MNNYNILINFYKIMQESKLFSQFLTILIKGYDFILDIWST